MSKIFIILILSFLILLVWIFFLSPRYQDIRILKIEILKQKKELSLQKEYILKLENLSKELEKYKEEVSKIDFALPSNPNIPLIFDFLEKASSENGLLLEKIDSFSITDLKEKPDLKEIRISFEVLGSYDALLNFLSTLEKSARLIEVTFVDFTLPKEGEIFSFKIKIKTFTMTKIPSKKIEINFETLRNPILKELEKFEEISLPEEKGRENPFLPY